MEFYQYVILALLTGIVSPLAVFYIKAAFPPKSARKEDDEKPD